MKAQVKGIILNSQKLTTEYAPFREEPERLLQFEDLNSEVIEELRVEVPKIRANNNRFPYGDGTVWEKKTSDGAKAGIFFPSRKSLINPDVYNVNQEGKVVRTFKHAGDRYHAVCTTRKGVVMAIGGNQSLAKLLFTHGDHEVLRKKFIMDLNIGTMSKYGLELLRSDRMLAPDGKVVECASNHDHDIVGGVDPKTDAVIYLHNEEEEKKQRREDRRDPRMDVFVSRKNLLSAHEILQSLPGQVSLYGDQNKPYPSDESCMIYVVIIAEYMIGGREAAERKWHEALENNHKIANVDAILHTYQISTSSNTLRMAGSPFAFAMPSEVHQLANVVFDMLAQEGKDKVTVGNFEVEFGRVGGGRSFHNGTLHCIFRHESLRAMTQYFSKHPRHGTAPAVASASASASAAMAAPRANIEYNNYLSSSMNQRPVPPTSSRLLNDETQLQDNRKPSARPSSSNDHFGNGGQNQRRRHHNHHPASSGVPRPYQHRATGLSSQQDSRPPQQQEQNSSHGPVPAVGDDSNFYGPYDVEPNHPSQPQYNGSQFQGNHGSHHPQGYRRPLNQQPVEQHPGQQQLARRQQGNAVPNHYYQQQQRLLAHQPAWGQQHLPQPGPGHQHYNNGGAIVDPWLSNDPGQYLTQQMSQREWLAREDYKAKEQREEENRKEKERREEENRKEKERREEENRKEKERREEADRIRNELQAKLDEQNAERIADLKAQLNDKEAQLNDKEAQLNDERKRTNIITSNLDRGFQGVNTNLTGLKSAITSNQENLTSTVNRTVKKALQENQEQQPASINRALNFDRFLGRRPDPQQTHELIGANNSWDSPGMDDGSNNNNSDDEEEASNANANANHQMNFRPTMGGSPLPSTTVDENRSGNNNHVGGGVQFTNQHVPTPRAATSFRRRAGTPQSSTPIEDDDGDEDTNNLPVTGAPILRRLGKKEVDMQRRHASSPSSPAPFAQSQMLAARRGANAAADPSSSSLQSNNAFSFGPAGSNTTFASNSGSATFGSGTFGSGSFGSGSFGSGPVGGYRSFGPQGSSGFGSSGTTNTNHASGPHRVGEDSALTEEAPTAVTATANNIEISGVSMAHPDAPTPDAPSAAEASKSDDLDEAATSFPATNNTDDTVVVDSDDDDDQENHDDAVVEKVKNLALSLGDMDEDSLEVHDVLDKVRGILRDYFGEFYEERAVSEYQSSLVDALYAYLENKTEDNKKAMLRKIARMAALKPRLIRVAANLVPCIVCGGMIDKTHKCVVCENSCHNPAIGCSVPHDEDGFGAKVVCNNCNKKEEEAAPPATQADEVGGPSPAPAPTPESTEAPDTVREVAAPAGESKVDDLEGNEELVDEIGEQHQLVPPAPELEEDAVRDREDAPAGESKVDEGNEELVDEIGEHPDLVPELEAEPVQEEAPAMIIEGAPADDNEEEEQTVLCRGTNSDGGPCGRRFKPSTRTKKGMDPRYCHWHWRQAEQEG